MNSFPWNTLIDWYKTNGRHSLPWRDYTVMSGETENGQQKTDNRKLTTENSLIYRVWLSEILLQQTQASRVVGFFERMIERFPTIASLGETDYETFFPYYQGLGYYSRARNILKTAKIISEEYGGIFPRDKSLLQKLPGVGGYTSSAILAFGYGDPHLAWDTNLEKVFARYYHGTRLDTLSEEEKKWVEADFYKFIETMSAKNGETEGGKLSESDDREKLASEANEFFHPSGAFGTFHSGKVQPASIIRAINNALMDFASLIDLKNPDAINWEAYPLMSGRFYETRGSLEPREVKISRSFPTPDATVVVILHKDHKVYYSGKLQVESYKLGMDDITQTRSSEPATCNLQPATDEVYSPFILPPALTRDTREYVKSYFRDTYGLELSVRPAHKKGFTEDGKPYLIVNAQIQTGESSIFKQFSKKETELFISKLLDLTKNL